MGLQVFLQGLDLREHQLVLDLPCHLVDPNTHRETEVLPSV